MAVQLKIVAMTVDGCPYTCPECGTSTLSLEAGAPIDALASVWGNCSSSHSWEDFIFTLGDLKAIQAASTGRERAEDIDTFRLIIGGALIEGVLHPEVILDDIKRAVTDVYWGRLIKPALRRRKNAAKHALKQPVKAATRAARRTAGNTVASAKAAAVGAAWDWQAGGHEPDPGYEPEPVIPCAAGCDRGYFTIDSRIHKLTRVRCTACSGTGEA
mgnify:CR=1 FL=1